MGLKCFKCGKGVMYGHRVSHAKNRTRRIFKPSLHGARIMIGRTPKRVRLCTKCLRRAKKDMQREQVRQSIAVSPAPSQATL